MITLKDVARECNVSLATVSKALNGQPDIGPETRAFVKKKAAELGYLPNASARALKTKKSHNIGVLFVDQTASGLAHEYFSEILNSIRTTSEERGYDITFITRDFGNVEMSFYEHARYRNCDGVIVVTAEFRSPEVIELVEGKIPTVTLDYVFDGNTSILSDNVKGMEELLQYVYDLGHRKIAIIHGEKTAVTGKRLASFYKMCEKLNIEVKDEYVKQAGYHDVDKTASATKELLQLAEKPTCIFFPDDFSYIGGMNEIEKAGLSIPEDISAVGYDGILLTQVLRPKLTTYKQDAKNLGRIAAEQMIEEIENPKTFIPSQFVVSGKLLEGNTVKDLRR